ncbi:uracil-DNA glycosylase [Alkaliphilus sp. B6464]|uniref:uracil-DNA glycosylase n=1 Tax=Alkaliphilus sp. B6464 TaxID=2731219 RepID=UPI001BA8B062|nr:uracil-DNA glycosylase [Alkaliphilus sp. B6464]QUH19366.1 uracil-DNA glycosylase [Alkaliphilus sp. B6464]
MKLEKLNGLYKQIATLTQDDYITGSGNVDAKILLVGEAPGAKEIELKEPFVGQAGKNLNEFLEILQIKREDLFITNVVKFRPHKTNEKTGRKINRPPTQEEVRLFSNILKEEINIISPKIIVTLGNTPLKSVMANNKLTIGAVHGQILEKGTFLIFPLYHPASIIYNQNLKETYLDDLSKLKEIINIDAFL